MLWLSINAKFRTKINEIQVFKNLIVFELIKKWEQSAPLWQNNLMIQGFCYL